MIFCCWLIFLIPILYLIVLICMGSMHLILLFMVSVIYSVLFFVFCNFCHTFVVFLNFVEISWGLHWRQACKLLLWRPVGSSGQSLSRVWLFATPWIAARQASLSITNSRSLLKLMPIESVMPSSISSSVIPFSSCPWPLPPSVGRDHLKL